MAQGAQHFSRKAPMSENEKSKIVRLYRLLISEGHGRSSTTIIRTRMHCSPEAVKIALDEARKNGAL